MTAAQNLDRTFDSAGVPSEYPFVFTYNFPGVPEYLHCEKGRKHIN